MEVESDEAENERLKESILILRNEANEQVRTSIKRLCSISFGI